VNPLLFVGILAAAVGLAVGLLLVARRLPPDGGFLHDAARANAIYTMVATAFAVLLAFVALVAFQSFNEGRSGAESEAEAVAELFRTAGYFPPADGRLLQAEIACYARAAVAEWPDMEEGRRSGVVDDWVQRIQRRALALPVDSPKRQEAFASFLDDEDDRSQGRRERLGEAAPVVSTPVWLALGVGGLVVILAALLFADRRERFVVQSFLIAAITLMITSGLVLIWFLDHPYEDSAGSIKPVEMQRSIEQMQEERPGLPRVCDSSGQASGGEAA
jgi:hypothetical protein